MPRGGYQQPRHPAPVSGPGRKSRRTDGGPAKGGVRKMELHGQGYGDSKEFDDIQRMAKMGGEVAQPNPVDTSGITPLDAPTARPDEPITSGSNLGAGPGPEALGQNPQRVAMDEKTKARMRQWMPVLMFQASQPDASDETRQFVRQLRGDLL